MIRLHGEIVYKGVLTDESDVAFEAGSAHFYFVETGTLWVSTAGSDPVELGEGSVALLPHGQGHLITDKVSTSAGQIKPFGNSLFPNDPLSLSCGTSGSVSATFVGGSFRLEGGAAVDGTFCPASTNLHPASEGRSACLAAGDFAFPDR